MQTGAEVQLPSPSTHEAEFIGEEDEVEPTPMPTLSPQDDGSVRPDNNTPPPEPEKEEASFSPAVEPQVQTTQQREQPQDQSGNERAQVTTTQTGNGEQQQTGQEQPAQDPTLGEGIPITARQAMIGVGALGGLYMATNILGGD